MNDSTIITLLRTGSGDKALDALYVSFPAVRKMIRQTGGRSQDAEDIFQEALIILCRKIASGDFTLTARLSTWLYSVCRHLWKDELKKKNRQIPGDPEDLLPPADEAVLDAIVEQEQQNRLAEKVLDELGDRCRELLLLYYKAGLKLKDIASKMGYNSEATAKNQKYKCLEGARNKLKEYAAAAHTI